MFEIRLLDLKRRAPGLWEVGLWARRDGASDEIFTVGGLGFNDLARGQQVELIAAATEVVAEQLVLGLGSTAGLTIDAEAIPELRRTSLADVQRVLADVVLSRPNDPSLVLLAFAIDEPDGHQPAI